MMCIFNNVRWAHYHAFVISFQNYYFKKSFTLCLQIIGEILRDIVGRKEERKKEARKNFQEIVKNDFVGSTHMHMCEAHMWHTCGTSKRANRLCKFFFYSNYLQR
eukprot:TRINITY_DN7609_c1_g2_i5.p1 TRINITY_DN7609_c1_g2~~TRINITY_DN7609_c1_g2_i5.p1  ORF type:complete len:105 (-),score=11.64 TRINITY_DN7609_c1_g2_i5:197-511(-)